MCEATFSNEEAVQVHLTDDHNAIVLVEGDAQGRCIYCLLVLKPNQDVYSMNGKIMNINDYPTNGKYNEHQ